MKLGKLFRALSKLCIFFTLCMILCINASADSSRHWYCKRTADHSQPGIDTDMQWIEQVGGTYLDKHHQNYNEDKVIYLTFDAGYENGNIAKILDVMQEQNVTGAFFILGNLIERNPDLVKRMAEQGHLVCNHTYTHKNITTMSQSELNAELDRLENAYQQLTGKPMDKYFRPPEGTFDQSSLKVVSDCGYKTVFWSFAYADWDNHKQMSPQAAKKKIFDNLHNGEIMLLHPTSATNAQILGEVISDLKGMGYRFGTLDELEFGA